MYSEIGKSIMRQASERESMQSQQGIKKKKTLHIYDFKKFKFKKNVESIYKFGKVIGQGAFGQVRLCRHFATGREFAIKIMTKKQIEK